MMNFHAYTVLGDDEITSATKDKPSSFADGMDEARRLIDRKISQGQKALVGVGHIVHPPDGSGMQCSECGIQIGRLVAGRSPMNFCWNCGARLQMPMNVTIPYTLE